MRIFIKKEWSKLRKEIIHLKEIGFKISTFDPQDANAYDLKLKRM